MAKFRQGDLVLTSTQKITQGSNDILAENAVLQNIASLTLQSGETITNFSSDTNLGSSNSIVPTQNAIKTYIDTKVPGSVGSGTDNRIVRYDGSSSLQDSLVTIDDSGNMSGAISLSVSGSIDADKTGSGGKISLVAIDGAIEITREAGGAFIDFKNSAVEDYDVRIQENSSGLHFVSNSTGSLAYFNSGGAFQAYYSGSLTLATQSNGITVYNSSNSSYNMHLQPAGTSCSIYGGTTGATFNIFSKNDAGSYTSVFSANPDGSAKLYYSGVLSAFTSAEGLSIQDTSGTTPILRWVSDASAVLGQMYSSSGNIVILTQATSGKSITLYGHTGVAVETLITATQGSNVKIYHAGVKAFQTAVDGSIFYYTGGGSAIQTVEVVAAANTFGMYGYVHGNPFVVTSEDAGGTSRTLINSDPDAGTSLYYTGTEKLRTVGAGIYVYGGAVRVYDQGSTNEGGEIQLMGEGSNNVITIDNYGGHCRIFGSNNSNDIQVQFLNSGTQDIKFKIGSAGYLEPGQSSPAGTDVLGYNGYLYATKVYGAVWG